VSVVPTILLLLQRLYYTHRETNYNQDITVSQCSTVVRATSQLTAKLGVTEVYHPNLDNIQHA